ncbi:MAG: Bifunctional transcriptional activator/DNA repair enzyme Ada [Herbaspirillum frisingense]|uniref:methylated-DNA--[protein]-cysteine S-methyltransferase n=1 Tax=Herbaspirillum frisingense TaxID=92645 RepID=A0A7V8FU60_9BURK|nr:MAG: Bifunctional transcriptional activator/DNA repair enzyme Ada [Herbaspirillum frisingense]
MHTMTTLTSRRLAKAPAPSAAPARTLTAAYAGDETRWHAVQQRDKAADGHFWYSVRSTGVYCKPSCAARPALRKNVAFHDSCGAAEAAGFRPCLRCKPDQPPLEERQAQAVEQACRLIEQADSAPDLATLAQAVGISRYHFHRIFKAHTGLTPKAYADARRAQRVRSKLPGSASVTEAMYDAGFNSSGRFYEQSTEQLGMKPSAYRSGGGGERIRFAVAQCWLGALLVAATAKGICAVTLGDDPEALVRELQDRFPKAELVGGDADFERMLAQVLGAIEDPARGIDLPLDVRGTAFQQRVWQALRSVPPGVTLTYSELAGRVGNPGAVRAVASACANNDIALLIPCHRIVRLDGSFSGYRWGVERKQALLDKERAAKP